MDQILGDVPHTFVYLDDILIASSTMEEHIQDLERVFKILNDNGLVINRKKCILGKPKVEFLGHEVDSQGIRPLKEKVEAILAVKPPTSIKELQRFHGMINYYRQFVRSAAHHMSHLFDALAGKPKKLDWDEKKQYSFESIKQALANSTLLHHPDPSLPLAVTTDASDVAIGGVIEQRGPEGWEPLAFFSKKLSKGQAAWCPYDRELMAAHQGIRHFKHMVEGRAFTLYTDHQSLVPSLFKKTDAPTSRQTNQLSEIAEYTTDIRYLEGKSNFVADALSRPNGENAAEKKKQAVPISAVKSGLKLGRHIFLQELDKIWSRQKEAEDEVLPINNVECPGCIEWQQQQLQQQQQQQQSAINNINSIAEQEEIDLGEKRYQNLISYKEKPQPPSTTASAAAERRQQSSGHGLPSSKRLSKQANSFDPNWTPEHIEWGLFPPSSALKSKSASLDEQLQPNGMPSVSEISQTGVTNSGACPPTKISAKKDEEKISAPFVTVYKQNKPFPANATPSAPNQLTNDDQTLQRHAPNVPGCHPEENAKVFQSGAPQGPFVQNALTNPDDGGSFLQKSSEKENATLKKSDSANLEVSRHAEHDGNIHFHEKNRDQGATYENSSPHYANEQKCEKPISEQKMEDLKAVINSIDHYQINLEEMAVDQPLDQDFQTLSREATTGLRFRKVKIGENFL
ncbi:MAG: reverse transcriptase family protein, partial [SAR324 cluster bacterium]|nr:reverse transcriptase family protein [SAR324 cluster bacterium]